MATSIPEVTGIDIKHCLLIDLTIDATTYYISNAYKRLTYGGNTYTELGSFLQMGDITEDLKTTNGDVVIALSGVINDNVTYVLNNNIKGGNITIQRAFLDDSYAITNAYQRYKGIVTNWAIEEDEDLIESTITNTVSITTASINTILENRISGQRTNSVDRNKFYPGDGTFDRVQKLHNVNFDFGREYTGGTGYGGGGYGGGGYGGGGYGGGGGGRNRVLV